MSDKTVNFTEPFIKKIATHPEYAGTHQRDNQVPGLAAYVSAGQVVTFHVRVRVGGKKQSKALGTYDPDNFNVNHARKKARAQKTEWEQHGVKSEAISPALSEVLAEYKKRRLQNDKLAKGRVPGMPKAWEDCVVKFQTMCAPLMDEPIHTIKREDFLDCQFSYLTTVAKARGEKIANDEVLDDKSLRPMWANIIQALNYAVKRGWLPYPEAEGLIPENYEDRSRFLLPGEWQRVAPLIDELPSDGGKFLRFLLATGVRLTMALKMPWTQVDPPLDVPMQDGSVHTIRIWRVPRGVMKKDRPVLIPLIGESLRIFEYFERQRTESDSKKERERMTVFTAEVISMWRSNSGRRQRWLEEESGTQRWHRHDLRRTLATYLKYVKTSQGLVSLVLSHSGSANGEARSERDAAQATKVYTRDDALGDCFGKNEKEYLNTVDTDDMLDVVRAHLRVQELFRQMESGELSPLLARIQTTIAMGPNANEMMAEYNVQSKWIKIEKPATIAKWLNERKAARESASKSGNPLTNASAQ